ncbi:hypothetical protein BS78_06G012800 [Paspalum vaginatum]|nr:hypothetical protein BS78_06G012800 [Paspalum vaginatum]
MAAAGNEPPPAPGAGDRWYDAILNCCMVVTMVVVVFGVLFMFLRWAGDPPAYYVAIPSASGLDYPRSGGGQPATAHPPLLDPLFNLTVRIASKSSKGPECMNPTTSVHVHYMGVQLASERVPPGLCAAPRRRSEELRVVARGEAVAMSPFLLDTLARDVGSGNALFKVVLMSPDGDHWDARTCMARIGKPAAECSCPDVVDAS